MDDDETIDPFEGSQETFKAKQKAYRRKIYLAMKEKKREYTLKIREEKKKKKALDREEALRQKNASLWASLSIGSKLKLVPPEPAPPIAKNPFLSTDED